MKEMRKESSVKEGARLESYSKAVLSEFIRRTIAVGPVELSKLEELERQASIDRAVEKMEELLLKMNELNARPASLEETKQFMKLSDEFERLNLKIARLRTAS